MDWQTIALIFSVLINLAASRQLAPIAALLILRNESLNGVYAAPFLPPARGILPPLSETVSVAGSTVTVRTETPQEIVSEEAGTIVSRIGSTVRVRFDSGRPDQFMHFPTGWPFDRPLHNAARTYDRIA